MAASLNPPREVISVQAPRPWRVAVAIALPTALLVMGCGRHAATVPPVNQPAQSQPAQSEPAASSAPASATLDPQVQSDLNSINDQMNGLGGDLQSAAATPEGDPSQ